MNCIIPILYTMEWGFYNSVSKVANAICLYRKKEELFCFLLYFL